jgi:epsilon-lactone hydrolase
VKEASVERQIDILRARFAEQRAEGAPFDLDKLRAFVNSRRVDDPLRKGWSAQATELGGRPALHLRGPGAKPDRALLYFHGGGYVCGSPESHRTLVAEIAAAAGAGGFALDYRLAPEHPFPAAVDDAVAAYRDLLARGFAPTRIMLGGDSAGGGLAVAAAARIATESLPAPAAVIALSPWADLTNSASTHAEKAEDDLLATTAGLNKCAALYLAGADPRSAYASPTHASLGGLPPLLIQVGSDEILLGDAEALKTAAREQGVDATLEIWPGMFHVWHGYFAELEEGQEAIEELGAWMKRRWK